MDTHFAGAQTDSMPAQRPLLTIQAALPATPRELRPRQPCRIVWEQGVGWEAKRNLPHRGATKPSKNANSQLLASHCTLQGTLRISQEQALQGLWLVGASMHSLSLPWAAATAGAGVTHGRAEHSYVLMWKLRPTEGKVTQSGCGPTTC